MCLTERVRQRHCKIYIFPNMADEALNCAHGLVQRSKETRQQQLQLCILCSYTNGDFITLHGHEVGKVPDEFANDVLLPLLVQDVVVAPQHDVLVLLGEHHRWILARAKPQS